LKSFVHRNYSSKYYRPQPIIKSELNSSILLISTPWGNPKAAEKSIEFISEFYLSAVSDTEATSPFEIIFTLSYEANMLRTAILLANERIYREENEDEYVSACELIAIARVGNELHIVQVGQPGVYLARNSFCLQPIGGQLDLSLSVSNKNSMLSPLPSKLMGLEKNIDISVCTMIPQNKDKLVLISRTFLPNYFFQSQSLVKPNSNLDLDQIVRNVIQEDKESPFWVGILEL
jgi:hypothetical protein